RAVVEKHAPKALPDAPSAENGAMNLLEREAVIKALRKLPTRQREAIVLRYYGDLSEAQIADAMKISRGAVKSHTSRGISALRSVLEQTTLAAPQLPRTDDSRPSSGNVSRGRPIGPRPARKASI